MKTYVFPGQGSQHIGMGKDLFDDFPELVEKADNILGYSIKELCLEDQDNKLTSTQYTQPALYIVNALTYYDKLRKGLSKPDFVAGHSLGEYNAILASDGFDFETGLKLVKKRGELMGNVDSGSMAAVIGITQNEIKDIIESMQLNSIDIANINSKNQTVISGPQKDIEKSKDYFENMGARVVKLNVSAAFHSRYMRDVSDEYSLWIKQHKFSPLNIPVISNITAKPYTNDKLLENLSKQLYYPVRWLESIEYLLKQDAEMEFVEIGPGRVLTNLISNIRKNHNFTIKNNNFDKISDYVEEWNKRFPIGSKFTCEGYKDILISRSKAVVLFGHRGAVYMKGYNGYFDIEEIEYTF